MHSVISLAARRYTLLDSIGIAFRCAPVAAFFYGFFDLAMAALTPVITLVAARLIDAVVRTAQVGAPVGDVYRLLLFLAGLTAVGWLSAALHNFADLRLVLALRARYRTALTKKRTRLAYPLIEQSETWDLIQRVAANPEGGRLKLTYYHLIDLAAFIIKVGGLLIILAAAVWWAPLVVIGVAGSALYIGIRSGKALYAAEREVAAHDRRLDYLGTVMLGRDAAAERTLFGASPMLTAMWRATFQRALGVRFRARRQWYINAYAGNLTNLGIWVLLMLLLLPALQSGALSVGLFIALTQAFTRFDIVWGLMDTVNGLAADAEFFKDLTTFLALPEEGDTPDTTAAVATHKAAAAPPTVPAPLIELCDVRFRYPGTERWILDGLNLTLEAGKHYALVGANGCGKTTVTRLLTGLYPVDAGGIRIKGRPIEAYSYTELRALFAVVYQDFARYG
ncbi:MAG: ABC transporter ATP-binding protein, partial [Caldilineaceae bacterium]|nr:ABC transporter ATP-binding protein [Caldilineaceae bacterium]